MVAWANKDVFLQIWIGVDDKLPRRVRAIYAADPLQLRNELELSNWQLDAAIAPDAFASPKAQAAPRMAFARPASARRRESSRWSRWRRPRRRRRSRNRSHHDRRFAMKAIITVTTALIVGASPCGPARRPAGARPTAPAAARATARARPATRIAAGGSSTHEAGEGTEHTNTYGGSTAHADGGGTEHTNTYGGSTYGAYGEGATTRTPSGATAYHPPGYAAYPTYPAYHPPVAVPYYSSTCSGCAAAAGAVVGVAAGAAVASANTAAATSNAYAQELPPAARTRRRRPVPPTARGVATGAAPASGTWDGNYAALPAGSMAINKNGTTYYLNGNTWFQPAYGANGVYYTVVAAP